MLQLSFLIDPPTQRHRVAVRLVALDGTAMDGEIFLQAAAYEADRLETLSAKLSDQRLRFLPVGDGHRVRLVRSRWIAYLEVAGAPGEIAELEAVGARREPVEMELVTGETLRGDLIFLPPSGNNGVFDLLNAPGDRFLILVDAERTRYVQREALTRVLP